MTQQKYQAPSRADTVFENPSSIPYGNVQCTRVYKSVQAFKDACASAYRSHFSDLYLAHAEEAFGDDYPGLFLTESQKVQPDAQTAAFNPLFDSSFRTAERDGLTKGKEDIYNKTYQEQYRASYYNELPGATTKADADARAEMKSWVTQNAAITIHAHELNKQALRGGDEAKLLIDFKNVSPQNLKSSILLKLTTNNNVQLARQEFAVTKVEGFKISRFEEISFKVPASARSGEKISIRVDAVIPGHKYQQQRTENFRIEKTLAANPKIESKTTYIARPDVRTILGRTIIHKFVLNLKPVVEDIPDGYQVSLEVSSGQNLINFKGETKATGPMKANIAQDVEFSYTFPKNAKNQKVELKLTIKYLGEIIGQQAIELTPKN